MTPLELTRIVQQAETLLNAEQAASAEALLRPCLGAGTGPTVLWRLLAHALRKQARLEETRQIQQMIVDAIPGDLSGRYDLSETLLLQGNFTQGWREYRYRYSLAHTRQIERKVQVPRWDGQPVPGKTLLIHDEQGYGDTFQFLRLVRQARARSGARVILEINHESLSLAQRSGGFDVIIPRGTLPPPFDLHCEMMSLPQALGLQLADLPGPMPYFSALSERVEKWRQRLDGLARPWVALVWAGRPTHVNDANRSITLNHLAPLAHPQITFLALQKGPAAEQAATPPAGMNLLSLSHEIDDFEDSAAILTLADLLISVDSSPVHLAGALGRPAWVMLPFIPDWRWLMQRDDSPWYPGMRLFRQSAARDWPGVIECMRVALTDWCAGQSKK